MKKIITMLALFGTVTIAAHSQSDKYESAMKKGLLMMDSAKSTADNQAVSATFERIANTEKTQWLPFYYAGLSLTTAGWMDVNLDKDANAERVIAFCDKADALTTTDADKAEILTLRNMAATQQMLVDPQSRYMNYGMQAGKYLQEAMTLDPNNPRLYYLKGASLFGTPEQFGGGKAAAKPVLEKAVSLYQTAKPKPLYPHWGLERAQEMLDQCK